MPVPIDFLPNRRLLTAALLPVDAPAATTPLNARHDNGPLADNPASAVGQSVARSQRR